MCGIAGFLSSAPTASNISRRILATQIDRIRHRGPDGEGIWVSTDGHAGLAHVRLAIIDLTTGAQPMISDTGNAITYNGEIYNYIELRKKIGEGCFRTTSDTEVILRAYEKWGERCVEKLRGMFAFALWDAVRGRLYLARDRFGIKPLYYAIVGERFYFASEIKALLPFLPAIETNASGLHDYFCFQFCLEGRTLFKGIHQFPPAHHAYLDAELKIAPRRYWEVKYDLDLDHTEKYFIERLQAAVGESLDMHLRSDVEVGAYVSGGIDSSLIATLAAPRNQNRRLQIFHGKFGLDAAYDESRYAKALAEENGILLHEIDIAEHDFVESIAPVIRHLDEPVAGPGSFPQFIVSRLVRERGIKVVLGGQGGDEIFGGYARYLIAYWEQCIRGALEGTMHSGKFVVTYESIIQNLQTLRTYIPLIKEFWSEGLFDSRDRRYFRLVNRSNTFGDIIDWGMFDREATFESFKTIFWGRNVEQESYFDSMTHFDFKTLLPALLHVEDRMSMAHGIESRVPFLDQEIVEFAATVPSNVKFKNGELKRLLRVAFADHLPGFIRDRKDKMGFPVPLQLWLRRAGQTRDYVMDIMTSSRARGRFYLTNEFDAADLIDSGSVFGRNLWAFLSLELWQREFHDRAAEWRFRGEV